MVRARDVTGYQVFLQEIYENNIEFLFYFS